MKTLFIFTLVFLISLTAFAWRMDDVEKPTPKGKTVDGWATLSVLVVDVVEGEYQIKDLPYVLCAGIPSQGVVPALTLEYNVPTTGCGSNGYVNLNELICAKVEVTKQNEDLEVEAVKLNLSGCKTSNGEPRFSYNVFKTMAKEAVTKSFKNIGFTVEVTVVD